MKIIIIGGVAGGAAAAARLRRLSESAEIIMLERGGFISFANCGLPYYIGGDIKEKEALTLQTPENFHKRFHIDVRIFHEAVTIDPAKKTVLIRNVESGQEYTETYDKLILSPGAEPILPPLKGVDSPRVFTLRNIPDTLKIKAYIEKSKPKSAVVIGGGYIGVEMAENLKKAGLDVTIAELADHVIAPLDFDMAADVHHYLKAKGIHLITGSAVQEIRQDGDTLKVIVGSQTLSADMALLAVGVRPETGLAAACGISCGVR